MGKLELLMSGAKGGANRSANFLIQSSGNSNFGTVFLAERANFLIQIFLEKYTLKKSIKQWTPTNRGLTCLSLPQAPEEKRRKRKQKKAKQGENRLGVPIFIENL